MNKKIKVLLLIFVLAIFIIILNKITNIKNLTYKVNYENAKFTIKEKYNKKDYYIELYTKYSTFNFRIPNLKKKRVIDKIYYYKDKEYECVFSVINDNIYFDMLCANDNIMYDYYSIIGKDSKLDEYVESIKEYKKEKFTDDLSDKKQMDDSIFYKKNDIGKSVIISSYRGLTTIDKSVVLFKNDVYDSEISLFLNDYYIIADYDNQFEFKYFYLVNLLDYSVTKIKYKDSISLDSYIQGVVDNKVYIYDKDNEKQYEIDPKKKSVKEISSLTKIRFYKNGKWTTLNKSSINRESYFEYDNLNNYFTDYDKVIETEKYYYLIDKVDDNYKVYRVDTNNIKIKKYLFSTDSTNIEFNNDYVYFLSEDNIFYYSDYTGLRTLLQNNELRFNSTITYYVY